MQELLFSAFLYTATFSFICWFHYNPNQSFTPVEPQDNKWEALESDDLVSDLWSLTQSESKSSTNTKPDNPLANTDTPKPQSQQQQASAVAAIQPLDGINLSKLPLRVCRKIASKLTALSESLAITQKVNGKDKPVSQLRAEIKNRLVKDPTTVTEVIVQYAAPAPQLPVPKNQVS